MWCRYFGAVVEDSSWVIFQIFSRTAQLIETKCGNVILICVEQIYTGVSFDPIGK